MPGTGGGCRSISRQARRQIGRRKAIPAAVVSTTVGTRCRRDLDHFSSHLMRQAGYSSFSTNFRALPMRLQAALAVRSQTVN